MNTEPSGCKVTANQKLIALLFIALLLIAVSLHAQSWDGLPVDLVILMSNATPGSTLTTSIVNAGIVSNTGGCTFSGVPSGWTVGKNQGLSNLGPVTVNGTSYFYAPSALDYGNLAHEDSANTTINNCVFPSTVGNYFQIMVGFTLGMPQQANGNDYDLIMIQDVSGLYADLQIGQSSCASDKQGVSIETHAVNPHSPVICITPLGSYFMALTWDTKNSEACAWIISVQGSMVNETCVADPGGAISNVRIFSNENGTDSGTTYYQNVMMRWTSPAPSSSLLDAPLFWLQTSPAPPTNLSIVVAETRRQSRTPKS